MNLNCWVKRKEIMINMLYIHRELQLWVVTHDYTMTIILPMNFSYETIYIHIYTDAKYQIQLILFPTCIFIDRFCHSVISQNWIHKPAAVNASAIHIFFLFHIRRFETIHIFHVYNYLCMYISRCAGECVNNVKRGIKNFHSSF